jgi:hypothetical protein
MRRIEGIQRGERTPIERNASACATSLNWSGQVDIAQHPAARRGAVVNLKLEGWQDAAQAGVS